MVLKTEKRRGKNMKKRPIKSHAFAFFCSFLPLHFPFTQNVGHVIAHSANYTYRLYRKNESFFFSIFSCVKPENKYRFTSIRAT